MKGKRIKKKVFVGLSGGVDSAVAAALLMRRGYAVVGVFLREYDMSLSENLRDSLACTQEADRASAVAVAAHLDIPFEEWDFRKEYGRDVVQYLVRGYRGGRTPNPDIMCNKHIKFGLFLERAVKQGADYIATGHYVRKIDSGFRIQDSRTYRLRIAKDKNKDQSYFLYTLTQKQLAHCLFPLGSKTKPEVREYAKKIGLPNWSRKDSQGICFIGNIAMKEFLKTAIPPRQGILQMDDGEVIGSHDGASYFTIGQRHGIGYAGGGEPCYVIATDVKKNTVTVAKGADHPALSRKELICSRVHWISGKKPLTPFRCKARIRYRQPLQACRLEVRGKRFEVVFDNPQRAITPGQAIVFYRGTEMLGGGIIE